jgi:hypothetical protein
MPDYKYAKIRSWHIVATASRTRCGRLVRFDAQLSGTLPLNEKSCESCNRLAIHDGDPAGVSYPALD